MVLSCLRMKSIQYLLVLCAKSCEVLQRAPYCCFCLKHLPGSAALSKSRSAKSCASVAPLKDPKARGTQHLSLQVTFGDSKDCSSSHNATESPNSSPSHPQLKPLNHCMCPQSSGSSPQCQEKDRSPVQTFSAGWGWEGRGGGGHRGFSARKPILFIQSLF